MALERLCKASLLACALTYSTAAFAYNVELARCTAAKHDVAQVAAALQLFKQDNARYPSTDEGLAVLVSPTPELAASGKYRNGGYLDRAPRDPWGDAYQYREPGNHGLGYDLWSWGADHGPGGQGREADIGNWSDDPCHQPWWMVAGDLGLFGAAFGFVLGLPVYVTGVVLKYRRRDTPGGSFRGFHLGVLVYLMILFATLQWFVSKIG